MSIKSGDSIEKAQDGYALSVPQPVILVVDDDRDVNETLASVLRLSGYPVYSAYDASQAVELATATQFDIAIVDYRLGEGSNGIDVIRTIRGLKPDLLAIMVTADTDRDTVIEALREGAFDYLSKPVQPDNLLRAVQKASLTIEETVAKHDEIHALRQSSEATSAAVRAKNEFLTQLSKEIRQPLSVILGFSELIANDEQSSISVDEIEAYVAAIREGSSELLDIVTEAQKLVMINNDRDTENVE